METIEKMRFGVLVEKGKIEIQERKLPALGELDVLIRQEACNICTTDYTQYLGLREHQGYPMACGHEGSGHVAAVGKAVKGFALGDHVALAARFCGYCDFCKVGREGFCAENAHAHRSEDGYRGPFGFADYVVAPARRCIKIAPDLPAGEGGFLEPLATVCKGIKLLRLRPLDTVAVIGAGTMGMLNAIALRALGHRALVSEVMPHKLENARAEGLKVVDAGALDPVAEVRRLTGGKGADAVIVAVGSTQANAQAIEMLKEQYGKVLFFAAAFPEPRLKISSNLIHYRHMQFYGTMGADLADFMEAAALLSNGAVKVGRLLEGAYFDLDHIQDAFEEASKPGKYRVTVRLETGEGRDAK